MACGEVSKTYMGRIYLAPREQQRASDGSTELWINFGWNTKGNVSFPPWIPALAPVCSQAQYDRMAKLITDYVNENGISMAAVRGTCCVLSGLLFAGPLSLTFGATSGGIANALIPMYGIYGVTGGLCLATCCGCKLKADAMTTQIRRIVQEGGWSGASPPEVKLCQASSPTGETPEFMGIDHFGRPLEATTGSKNYTRHGPVWPPLGYNVIVRVPAEYQVAQRWPGASGLAAVCPLPKSMRSHHTWHSVLGPRPPTRPSPLSPSSARVRTRGRCQRFRQ